MVSHTIVLIQINTDANQLHHIIKADLNATIKAVQVFHNFTGVK